MSKLTSIKNKYIINFMSKELSIIYSNNNLMLEIDIQLQSDLWLGQIEQLQYWIEKVSFRTLEYLNFANVANKVEFAILLTSDAGIRLLNDQYRGKDQPTNTLSFPAQELEPGNLNKMQFYNNFVLLGDIVFAIETIQNEVINQKKDFYNHFSHLLVHGILHLIGYDHEFDDQALIMENLEIDILSTLNISSPY
jgi:probable rRNA maturation factor